MNTSIFPNSGQFPLERKTAKFSLNFWPVRVHEKPSFRYVPNMLFAKRKRRKLPSNVIQFLHSIVRSKVRRWAHILGSTVPDPFRR